MEWFKILQESMEKSFSKFGEQIMGNIPTLLAALMILFVGWIIAKIISGAIRKGLSLAKFDTAAEKLNITDLLKKGNVTSAPSRLVGKFFYWMIMLVVLTASADTLQWTTVSELLTDAVAQLPKVFVAIALFVIGYYIANFIKDLIIGATSSLGVSAGRIIGNIVFYMLMVTVTLTALENVIDVSVITNNFQYILIAVLGAFSLSYGFAARDLTSNLLAGFANRNTFKKGQIIEVNGVKGEIVEVKNVSVSIQTNEGIIIVPSHTLMTNNVKVLQRARV